MKNYNIRPAEQRDIDKIYEIYVSSFPESLKKDFFEDTIKSERLILLISETKTEISGFILLQNSGYDLDIISMVISDKHRNKGYAKALLKEVLEKFKQTENKIFLEVSKNNIPAINLYKSCGFEILSERKNYYSSKNNEDAYVMG